MKVLAVHNSYQQAGGEDRVFAAEVELLASRGHEVMRLTAHNDAVRGVSALALGCRTTWSVSTYREMRDMLRRQRPDIVHVHNTLPLLSPAVYYAAHAARVPVVQTLHNYRLLCPQSLLLRDGKICEACVGRRVALPGIAHACYRGSRAATAAVAMMLSVHGLMGTWTNRVSRYIALTEFMRQKFLTAGFAPRQVVVKPNFVAPDPGLGPHRDGYALFVGRLAQEKGIRTLLEAWRHLGPGIPLKIVGDGPLQALLQIAPPGVEWLGRRSREEVFALMQHARMLVFPSEWYEGFPLTISEAFATGLPVVASRLGGMAELVEDHQTGLLFTPGDPLALASAVQWAGGHEGEVAEMGQRARAVYALKYTAGRNYELLRAIYQQVLERPRHAEVRDGVKRSPPRGCPAACPD